MKQFTESEPSDPQSKCLCLCHCCTPVPGTACLFNHVFFIIVCPCLLPIHCCSSLSFQVPTSLPYQSAFSVLYVHLLLFTFLLFPIFLSASSSIPSLSIIMEMFSICLPQPLHLLLFLLLFFLRPSSSSLTHSGVMVQYVSTLQFHKAVTWAWTPHIWCVLCFSFRDGNIHWNGTLKAWDYLDKS